MQYCLGISTIYACLFCLHMFLVISPYSEKLNCHLVHFFRFASFTFINSAVGSEIVVFDFTGHAGFAAGTW